MTENREVQAPSQPAETVEEVVQNAPDYEAEDQTVVEPRPSEQAMAEADQILSAKAARAKATPAPKPSQKRASASAKAKGTKAAAKPAKAAAKPKAAKVAVATEPVIKISWFATLDGKRTPRTGDERGAVRWDAKCTCGWKSGKPNTFAPVRKAVNEHKLEVHGIASKPRAAAA